MRIVCVLWLLHLRCSSAILLFSLSSSVIPLRSSLFCFHLSGFPLLICWSLLFQVHNQSGSVDWSFGGADLRRRPATPAVSSGEADVSHLYPLFLISVLPSVIALVACAASVRIGLIWFLGLGTIFSGLYHFKDNQLIIFILLSCLAGTVRRLYRE